MSTTDKVCFFPFGDDFLDFVRQFQDDFVNYGPNFRGINNLIQSATPNTVGIIGSYTFKYVSELQGVSTHNWDSQPSDVDICITNIETFRNFCCYFRRRGYDIEYEFEKIHDYYTTMADVEKVVNIRRKPTSTKYIQLILLNCKTVEEHLRNVDFDFTRVAYTSGGLMYIGNAIESIASRKCKFPSSFDSIEQFNKTWKRSIKYIGRGIEFEYPDVINIKTGVFNFYLRRTRNSLVTNHMYDMNISSEGNVTLLKKVTVTRVVSPEEKLEQISEIVSSTKIKKLKEDFEKKITERNFKISILEKKLFNESVKLSDAKKQLDKMKRKLINLKTSILKQFEIVPATPNRLEGKDSDWDDSGWDIEGWQRNNGFRSRTRPVGALAEGW